MRPCLVVVALAACGNNNSAPDGPSACTTGTVGGMGVLQDFCPPGDPGPNAFLVSASGEVLAITGYRFPPAHPGEFALVDGWDLSFSHVISTFDHVTLSSGPDTTCNDQSRTGGVVAEADGPWVVDLHKGGALVGKSGPPEQAVPIVAITHQNMNNNAGFDATVRYAFGFEIVPATAKAKNVNLDAADLPLYDEMIAKGCTTLLVGQAVWKGTTCAQSVIAGQTPAYDFSVLPNVVNFQLCLPAPTSYLDAQNPENDPAAPCQGEEHQRGVHTAHNVATVLQATFHLDHVLWESFVHDSPAHFDSFAARYAGATVTPTAQLEDFKGYRIAPFVDAQGKQVPWRSCVDPSVYPLPGGAMTFDTQSVAIDPIGTCTEGNCNVIRDFYDYTLYNHSTFGHLNADGLAFVQRHYPSP